MLRHIIIRQARLVSSQLPSKPAHRQPARSLAARSAVCPKTDPSPPVSAAIARPAPPRASQDGNSNRAHPDRLEPASPRGPPKTGATAGAGALLAAGIMSFFGPDEPPDVHDQQLFEDLHNAILEGRESEVRRLLKRCSPQDVNTRHEMGWQLLHLAAVAGRASICEMLIQSGAKINDTDDYTTPTLVARKLKVDPLLVALTREDQFSEQLARGINYKGCTALHYAVIANSLETVELLAKHGANPLAKSDQGLRPANLVSSPAVQKFLTQYERDYIGRQRELEEEERRKYPLEKRVKEHIVGQEAAISTVAATIRRKQNGWFDDDHPLVFLFLGSSGVGKTELAKRVAKYLHKDNRDAFVRLDMSEYQEQHSVARMIGSPPGYVGHQNGGQLTEALRKCNNAVVLFDEVEKAHPKVLTVLLQLFDEGRLTDGQGKTIECKDAIFIMTSNLASEAIAKHAMDLREEQQEARETRMKHKILGSATDKADDYQEHITISRWFKDTVVRPVLKAHLQRDEFLGRINEMVYFLPFSEGELKQLVSKELDFWASRARKRNSLEMTWDPEVVDVICEEYDYHYGARSIKHAVERRIINEVSELHFNNRNAKRVHISVRKSDSSDKPDLIHIKMS